MVKVKLYLPWHEGTLAGAEVQSHTFIISVLVVVSGQYDAPFTLPPGNKTDVYSIEPPRASCRRDKSLQPARDSKPRTIQFVE